jgi:hypothetical protein
MQTYTVTVKDDGTTTWRNELGQRHRLDGPAIEYASGACEWFQNGQLHRLNGPAGKYANGDRVWYQNDRLHRTDGPAVEHADGYREYWVNGKYLTPAEFEARTVKELTVAQVEALLGHRVKIKS